MPSGAVAGSGVYSLDGGVFASSGRRCRLCWTALGIILAPIPMMIRLIICPVTPHAASVLAVMSPNPAEANTVTVKYNAPACQLLAEAAARLGGDDELDAGE